MEKTVLTLEDREPLLELLRPPDGYRLDHALATTFSLDLERLLFLPLAFMRQDGLLSGEREPDPLAVLEALRRCRNQLTVFCEKGHTTMPTQFHRLVQLLEPCVHGVARCPKQGGVFHPKLWVLRFINAKAEPCYRVLCLSRNLSKDRSWDVVTSLDGVVLAKEVRASRPLARFVRDLMELPLEGAAPGREQRRKLTLIASELERTQFEVPEGFNVDEAVRFWPTGFGHEADPLKGRDQSRALVMAPFLNDGMVAKLQKNRELHLISRRDQLDALKEDSLKNTTSWWFDDGVQEESTGELSGLHAKLIVFEQGWHCAWFVGSHNATDAAFRQNVEFSVELPGMAKQVGIDVLLREDAERKEPLLRRLLVPYERTQSEPVELKEDDELQRAVIASVAEAGFALHATHSSSRWDVTLRAERGIALPPGAKLRAWMLSAPNIACELDARAEVTFAQVEVANVSAWTVFEFSHTDAKPHTWVVNLPLHGDSPQREASLMASLLASREQWHRYLLMLLSWDAEAAGDDADGAGAAALRWRIGQGDNETLLELMLRALHSQPASLRHLARLVRTLRESGEASSVLDEEFNQLWLPLEQVLPPAKEGEHDG